MISGNSLSVIGLENHLLVHEMKFLYRACSLKVEFEKNGEPYWEVDERLTEWVSWDEIIRQGYSRGPRRCIGMTLRKQDVENLLSQNEPEEPDWRPPETIPEDYYAG